MSAMIKFPISKGWIYGAMLLVASFAVPKSLLAQNTVSIQPIEFTASYVFRGGSKKALKRTTSSVQLPNLKAILDPAPLPKAIPVVVVDKQRQQTTKANPATPRFGYGADQEDRPADPAPQPPVANPLVPIDPGYDDVPVTPAPANPRPQQQSSTQILPPVQPQIDAGSYFQFSHSYFPRSYHFSIPCNPFPAIPYVSPGYGFYHPGCGTISRRAPLRGSCTSSRNYLSGFGRRFSFRFSF